MTGAHLKKDSPRFLAELQSKEIVWYKGEELWLPRKSVAYLKEKVENTRDWKYLTGFAILCQWRKGCRWLGGKKLEGRKLPGLFERRTRYDYADQVREIASSMLNGEQAPVFAREELMDDVAEAIGRCRDHVRWLFKKWAKLTKRKGPNASPTLHWGCSENGDPVQRSYVPTAFAEWAKNRIEAEQLRMDEMTVMDFADAKGEDPVSVRNKVRYRNLRVRIVRGKGRDGLVRPVLAFNAKSGLGEVQAPTPKECKATINGEEQTLLPASLARSKYPHVPDYVFYSYPNKYCPLIKEVLIAPPTHWPNGYRMGHNLTPRGFLKSQLRKFPRVKVVVQPAREKHLTWKRWRIEGLSRQEIRNKWEQETGECVSIHAIKAALYKLRKIPESQTMLAAGSVPVACAESRTKPLYVIVDGYSENGREEHKQSTKEAIEESAGLPVVAGLALLKQWAKAHLKKAALRIVELVCDAGGTCKIADVAIDEQVKWASPNELASGTAAYDAACDQALRRIRNTFDNHGQPWTIRPHGSHIVLKQNGGKA